MDTTIGIIGCGFTTSAWEVGGLGSIKQVLSNQDLPGQREDDPPWYDQTLSQYLPNVEVIIIERNWAITPTHLLKSTEIKIIVTIKEFNL